MNIIDFKSSIKNSILTHQDLLLLLQAYKKPNDKISALIKENILIGLKKGLYAVNESFSNIPIDKQELANLIYGPSYISLEYALAQYGLIPESVENVTSITLGRKKNYHNKIGGFTYQPLPLKIYSVGVQIHTNQRNASILFASPEKAVCDKVYCDKNAKVKSFNLMEEYIENDLRIEIDDLLKLDIVLLNRISEIFNHSKVKLFIEMLNKFKKHR